MIWGGFFDQSAMGVNGPISVPHRGCFESKEIKKKKKKKYEMGVVESTFIEHPTF